MHSAQQQYIQFLSHFVDNFILNDNLKSLRQKYSLQDILKNHSEELMNCFSDCYGIQFIPFAQFKKAIIQEIDEKEQFKRGIGPEHFEYTPISRIIE